MMVMTMPRDPLAGLAAGFAAVSGGYAGNLFPGASDALILGITEPAAQLIDPSYSFSSEVRSCFSEVAGAETPTDELALR